MPFHSGMTLNLSKLEDWIRQRQDSSCFRSQYVVPREGAQWIRSNRSLSGYKGQLHLPYAVFDFDGPDAQLNTRKLVGRLETMGIEEGQYMVWFSGHKGFHVEVPSEHLELPTFGTAPTFVTQYKRSATALAPHCDHAIYVLTSLYRLPYTRHSKSGLYKILVEDGMLDLQMDEIRSLAATKPEVGPTLTDMPEIDSRHTTDTPVVSHVYEPKVQVTKSRILPKDYVCAYHMTKPGPQPGHRHKTVLHLAAIYRAQGMSQDQSTALLDVWNKGANKLEDKELNKIVEQVYSKGYHPYGCKTPWMLKHCDKICVRYEGANEKKISTALDLLMDEVNWMKLHGTHLANFNVIDPKIEYPLMRGETIVFVGGPKSGKTSFMHNWLLKENTKKVLNVHLEMVGGQEMRRLLQVQYGYRVNADEKLDEVSDILVNATEEDLKELAKPFSHIRFWSKSKYIGDIITHIAEVKPDIVLLDSFEMIQGKLKTSNDNDTSMQKGTLIQLQHQARNMGHILVTIHHQNKTGTSMHVTSNSIGGVKEIVYAADHVIGFSMIQGQPNTRKLQALETRRHSNMDIRLVGDPYTLRWRVI